jgi:beta-glucosidase
MRRNPGVLLAALAACISLGPACAAEGVRCGSFAHEQLPAPVPSPYPSALERAKSINQAVKSGRYSILFFGDSLTEGWDAAVWEKSLAARGTLNAGVSGDRTDNLLWRLQNGNLAGPAPQAVVLLIGTNDLAYGRSPVLTADGIRAVLGELRQHLPTASILLLGLLPREESPSAPLRVATTKVNLLIRDCADGKHIVYADIGDVLLDKDGRLAPVISPDALHFSARGYSLLTPRLERELEGLPAHGR